LLRSSAMTIPNKVWMAAKRTTDHGPRTKEKFRSLRVAEGGPSSRTMHHEDNPACSGLHAPRTTIEIRKVRMRFGFRPQMAAPGRFVGPWAVALGLMLTGVAGALEDREPNKRDAGTPTPASRPVS